MARPTAFDRPYVLQQAIQLFWLHGYSNTSIKNLVEATGLQPGSIYAAFGDKRGLFLAALDVYFEAMQRDLFAALHNNKPPLERLNDFFKQLIQESHADPERKGCLLINTLSEIPVHDVEINTRLQTMFNQVEQELKQLLIEAKHADQLNPDQDPETLAKFLVSGIFGLRVFNKTQPDAKILKAIVKHLLASVQLS
ncbi:MAG: TetR/AcrR family transcriptional regulator [Methyloprofundus sp.]|nr:TetR/AcrR family transcriptional regulator [Methyloprofundus sp.]